MTGRLRSTQETVICAINPQQTSESNFVHHKFVIAEKPQIFNSKKHNRVIKPQIFNSEKHNRVKILSSIVVYTTFLFSQTFNLLSFAAWSCHGTGISAPLSPHLSTEWECTAPQIETLICTHRTTTLFHLTTTELLRSGRITDGMRRGWMTLRDSVFSSRTSEPTLLFCGLLLWRTRTNPRPCLQIFQHYYSLFIFLLSQDSEPGSRPTDKSCKNICAMFKFVF